MIWIKRVLPFVLIAIAIIGYRYYSIEKQTEELTKQTDYALITAQAWVASIKYRDTPELYLAYRDSLLKAHDLSADSLKMFIESYENRAEDLALMSAKIKFNVDSLLLAEDSLKLIADSVVQRDTTN